MAAGFLALAAPAFAHTGAGAVHGFAAGFWHPLMGADHLAAMIAIGLWASQIGGRALWAAPVSFVALLTLGGALGMQGEGLGAVETMIVASVIVLGLLVVLRAQPGVIAMAAVAGLFGVFHGVAHGAEMPGDASGLRYALGFVAATALLHATGIVAGLTLSRTLSGGGLRAAGAAVALFGVYLAAA
jgi:urease accessory protein